ncbi:divalent-cation tolerance protein CutA [Lysobacter arvi]|uniref:Divalent-cation tolerance protein CutA n=1 Tax=Lysobacter arvi TaxID=3038776 RepID=A0ABU1CFS6_9GAMM|nr:divalent-cation tolerance protein CutA [Lysobacter arvi]MDR0183808.1 divalent-cation tolerance protein CutA [Lysobacter arvi]
MHTPSEPRVRLVLSTCPDAQTADALATALVDERLAACVNVLPGVRSTYRWEGAIERGEEVLLLIKTTAARQDALIARLQALHPYELPEALAVEALGGLAAYLAWVDEQTRDDD